MKLRRLRIRNFRSIIDADIEAHDYTILVGANNAGKSNILAAIRAFYEDLKWSRDDLPLVGGKDGREGEESWVELTFELTETEWLGLADKYKSKTRHRLLTVRRYFAHEELVKSKQSNIYGVVDGKVVPGLFYGAKNVGTAKVGRLIYIPAVTTPVDQMKTTGPSPFRDMLNLTIKRLISDSEAYREVEAAFERLNEDATSRGILDRITRPLNEAIRQWGICFELKLNSVGPQDIVKNLVKPGFADQALSETPLSIDRYGHGFQRAFLYELINLSARFAEPSKSAKNDFEPELTLILFEEPEAFLHPTQQEEMAFSLRKLASEATDQVVITTHSPLFVGKSSGDLCQIVRVRRENGVTLVGQIKKGRLDDFLGHGLALRNCLKEFVDDPDVPEDEKKEARRLLNGGTDDEEVVLQEERFRYQLWLDAERAGMFFAERVLLVEGPTEKALLEWLLEKEWSDLRRYRVEVVDVLGKYNFHRFMALLDEFGIAYGMFVDDDKEKKHHRAVNDMLKNRIEKRRGARAVFIPNDIETFLGLEKPTRNDRKPIDVLKALENDEIEQKKLEQLKAWFVEALGLSMSQHPGEVLRT